MTTVISTINLKGGVGKTTMTIAMAEFLAIEHKKKVLLIDLDPQTNATVALIDESDWEARDKAGRTLDRLFRDKIEKKNSFRISDSIVKNASNIGGGIKGLDLLPSSIGLIEIQDRLPTVSSGDFFATSPITILRDAVADVSDQYDFILIDCPPSLGIITLNGLYFSDYYLIPAIPDILSTYGIPQILNRIKAFAEVTKQGKPLPLGIVISMYRSQSSLHNVTIEDLKAKAKSKVYPCVFNTIIPLTVRAAEASDVSSYANTLKQKYGYGRSYEEYSALTRELLNHV
ncbi:MAG: AAA family ATPase [Candidatus Thermoplasmatota archaeon]|nr:AAA family ATPase [Candidatus Thermoplasmatota archaeon]MCL5252945.1 AAA family ATPase [Candidatus Thermoplasmatota archaeon]